MKEINMPDIDIDFTDRDSALNLFKHIRASRVDDDRLVKHNTGVYFHPVPVNAVTNVCAVPYDQAEQLKYFKIDFLNVSIYKGIRDEKHLVELMNTEPLWDLLEDDNFVNLLFHVNGHGGILRQNEAQDRGAIGSNTSDNSSGKEISDWRDLVNNLERSLAKNRKQ